MSHSAGAALPTFREAASRLADIGRRFYARGWVLGTSGNFSAVVSRQPLRLAITPSAAHKGTLAAGAVPRDRRAAAGRRRRRARRSRRPRRCCTSRSSRARGAGAVLHTHSVWSTILSDRPRERDGGLAIEGYEMLKGLDGVATHEHREWIPIVDERSGHDAAGARRCAQVLSEHPARARVPARAPRALHVGPRRSPTPNGTSRFWSSCSRPSDEAQGGTSWRIVSIPEEHRTITRRGRRRARSSPTRGIDYEQHRAVGCPSGADAPADELLAAYKTKIDELKARGGYVTADVIDVLPAHAQPRRDAQQVQLRALARRGRSPLHRRGPRAVSHPSAGAGRCSRSKSRPAI